MNKIILLVMFFLFPLLAVSQGEWHKADGITIAGSVKVERKAFPSQFTLMQLDVAQFKSSLVGAPVRGNFKGRSQHLVYLPDAAGNIQKFYVMETPIMERELAAQFPTIKSYAAQGVDDPTAIARFSVTQFGLHSMTLAAGKSTTFIDPYTEDRKNYIIYTKSALDGYEHQFECMLDGNMPEPEHSTLTENEVMNANDGQLRTYRLALSCNGEYGALFAGTGTDAQKKSNIQAQMAITMTRVNGIYENDLGITMVFVANNAALIYYNPATDPWNNEFNTTTAQTIDAAIGFANYDIGHNFNTSGGGSAGCIGCVCSTVTNPGGNHKGRGFTGSSWPVGDPFDIDYVAHEMGHQFGGFHTQSSSQCRSGSGSTEVEPGSGSTVMGYAGICFQNVQNNSDAYFTYVNIRDILQNVKSGISSACPQITALTNSPPTADAGRDYVIPVSTPFMLVGSGFDPDGDALTYTWEQNDPQNPNSASAPTATRVQGPMYRSIAGTTNPVRFMPSKPTVLNGQLSNTWEVLSSVARELNFSLTVRDNVAGGGQTASDLMKVTVSGQAGPFAITAPNTVVTYAAASNQNVTWNVGGTDGNGVNTPYVDIYLSTNGGSNFNLLLASQVPNDGSEMVTIPNTPGTANRIMVKGHDNIFYDISNTNFTITAATSTFAIAFSGIEGEQKKSACKGTAVQFTFPYTVFAGFSNATAFTAIGHPTGSTVAFSPASLNTNGNVVLTIDNTINSTVGIYKIEVTATSGATTKKANLYLDLISNTFSTPELTTPANMAQVTPDNLLLSWSPSNGASQYDVQIATDAGFNTIVISGSTATNSYTVSELDNLSTYYWRVLPKNAGCSGSYTAASSFSTLFCGDKASANVPVTIPTSVATVTSTVTISAAESVTINDLNVNLDIAHTWINDLTVRLTSPAGTVVQLMGSECSPSNPIANILATFDDSGIAIVCGNNPGISGVVVPDQPLSAFNGQSSQGVWTLTVIDSFNQDGGQINNWSLNLCSPQPPLKVAENILTDFMVFPNPNSGNFNVKFSTLSDATIKLAVYDVSGRVIYQSDFENQTDFNQNLQLENVQSGVYLLQVTVGGFREIKRIIIN